eukprot:gnl/MRDRNA2_/MRDRNA2_120561_c0_seq1.p1 gnl/MRDRNA2_/MRDRNA2_120561_c0~~gnl/MRDRNA2_/MRDRNA2_120561_c0_seq1.p1  ORF type:complete len:207 (-),score=32.81 gnl/MRDRNA2_/MRDRNA2_120561_c0_seq1:92-712(-)
MDNFDMDDIPFGGSDDDDKKNSDDEASAMEKATQACGISCLGGMGFWASLAFLAYNEKRYVDQEVALGQDVHSHWLRYAMFLLNFICTVMFLYPLYTAIDVMGDYVDDLPGIGDTVEDVMEAAGGAALCVLSCMISCACSLMVFGIVWMTVHPTVGYITLGIGAVLIIGLCVYRCQAPPSQKRIKRQQKKGMIEKDDSADEELMES